MSSLDQRIQKLDRKRAKLLARWTTSGDRLERLRIARRGIKLDDKIANLRERQFTEHWRGLDTFFERDNDSDNHRI